MEQKQTHPKKPSILVLPLRTELGCNRIPDVQAATLTIFIL